jgi:hypothetical protein
MQPKPAQRCSHRVAQAEAGPKLLLQVRFGSTGRAARRGPESWPRPSSALWLATRASPNRFTIVIDSEMTEIQTAVGQMMVCTLVAHIGIEVPMASRGGFGPDQTSDHMLPSTDPGRASSFRVPGVDEAVSLGVLSELGLAREEPSRGGQEPSSASVTPQVMMLPVHTARVPRLPLDKVSSAWEETAPSNNDASGRRPHRPARPTVAPSSARTILHNTSRPGAAVVYRPQPAAVERLAGSDRGAQRALQRHVKSARATVSPRATGPSVSPIKGRPFKSSLRVPTNLRGTRALPKAFEKLRARTRGEEYVPVAASSEQKDSELVAVPLAEDEESLSPSHWFARRLALSTCDWGHGVTPDSLISASLQQVPGFSTLPFAEQPLTVLETLFRIIGRHDSSAPLQPTPLFWQPVSSTPDLHNGWLDVTHTTPSERIASLLSLGAGALSAIRVSETPSARIAGAMPHLWGIGAMRQLAERQGRREGLGPVRRHPAIESVLNAVRPQLHVVRSSEKKLLTRGTKASVLDTKETVSARQWKRAAWIPTNEAPWPEPADSTELGEGDGVAALLSDPAFVRVDLSTLPLEGFDDDGFEQRSPLEWLMSGPRISLRLTSEELSFWEAISEHPDSLLTRTIDSSGSMEAPLAFSPVWSSNVGTYRYCLCAVIAYEAPPPEEAVGRFHVRFLTLDELPSNLLRITTDVNKPSIPGVDVPQADILSAAATGRLGPSGLFNLFLSLGLLGPRSEGTRAYVASHGLHGTPLALTAEAATTFGPLMKRVPRLSVRFASESPLAHESRRACAAATREDTKSRLRYLHFLSAMETLPSQLVPLPSDWQQRVLRRAVRDADPREKLRRYVDQVRQVMEEAKSSFSIALRRAAYEYCLKHPLMRKRHIGLRLPVPPPRPPAPERAMLPVSPNGERLSSVDVRALLNQSLHLTVVPTWLPMYWLSSFFHVKLRNRRFVDLRVHDMFRWQDELSDLDKKILRDKTRRRMRLQLTGGIGATALPNGLLRRARGAKLVARAGEAPSGVKFESDSSQGDYTPVATADPTVPISDEEILSQSGLFHLVRSGIGAFQQDPTASRHDGPLELPTSLRSWVQHHSQAAAELLVDLDTDWRTRLVTELHDALHESHNLYMREPAEFAASPLRPLLHRVQLMMTTQIAELAEASVEDLVRFIAASSSFSTAAQGALWAFQGQSPHLEELVQRVDRVTQQPLSQQVAWWDTEAQLIRLAEAAGVLPARLAMLALRNGLDGEPTFRARMLATSLVPPPNEEDMGTILWHPLAAALPAKFSSVGFDFGHPGEPLSNAPALCNLPPTPAEGDDFQEEGKQPRLIKGSSRPDRFGASQPHPQQQQQQQQRSSRFKRVRPDSNTAMASVRALTLDDVQGGRDAASRWIVGPFPAIHGVHAFAQPVDHVASSSVASSASSQPFHRPALFRVKLEPCALKDLDEQQLIASLIAIAADLGQGMGAGTAASPFPQMVTVPVDTRSRASAGLRSDSAMTESSSQRPDTDDMTQPVMTREETRDEAQERAVGAAAEWQWTCAGVDLSQCSDACARATRVSPSPDDVKRALYSTLSCIAEAASSIDSIEGEVLTLLPVRSLPLLDISTAARGTERYPFPDTGSAARAHVVLGSSPTRVLSRWQGDSLPVPDCRRPTPPSSVASKRGMWDEASRPDGGAPPVPFPAEVPGALPRTVEVNPACLGTELRVAAARRVLDGLVEADAQAVRALSAMYSRYAWVLGLHPRSLVTGVVIRRQYRPLLGWMDVEDVELSRRWKRIVTSTMPEEASKVLLPSAPVASSKSPRATFRDTAAATAATATATASSSTAQGDFPPWMAAVEASGAKRRTSSVGALSFPDALELLGKHCSRFDGPEHSDVIAVLDRAQRVQVMGGWETDSDDDERTWPLPVGSMYHIPEDDEDVCGVPHAQLERARRKGVRARRTRRRDTARGSAIRSKTSRVTSKKFRDAGDDAEGKGLSDSHGPSEPKKRRVWDERALLRGLYRAGQEALRVSDDTVRMGIFEVDCKAYKRAVAIQSDVLVHAVACLVIFDCENILSGLESRFLALKERIQERPSDARGMDRQRKLIDAVDSDVAKLDSIATDTMARLEALGEFNIIVPEHMMRMALGGRLWPKKIAEAAMEAQAAMDLLSEEVASRLEDERQMFEKEMAKWPDRVLQFYSKGGDDLIRDKKLYDKTAEEAMQLHETLDNAGLTARDINEREVILGQLPTEFGRLTSLKQDFAPFYLLWSTVVAFENARDKWLKSRVVILVASDVAMSVSGWMGTCRTLMKQLKSMPPPLAVAVYLEKTLNDFARSIPVIEALASEAMSGPEHDKQCSEQWLKLGKVLSPSDVTMFHEDRPTLEALLELKVLEHLPEVEDISHVATKQLQLRKALETMEDELRQFPLQAKPHKQTGTYVLQNSEDIAAALDDQSVRVQTALLSPYIDEDTKAAALRWQALLVDAIDLLGVWVDVQRSWIYLEPIFGAHDIQKQMREHGHRFREADRLWRRCMSSAMAAGSVADVAENTGLLLQLQHAWTKLEGIQRDLAKFLDTKRRAFPRLFFLSNDELLELLAETKDPTRVQQYLPKAFDGLHRLCFEETDKSRVLKEEAATSHPPSTTTMRTSGFFDSSAGDAVDEADAERLEAEAARRLEGTLLITGMRSALGETVSFAKEHSIDPHLGKRRGNVEVWAADVENAMVSTLRRLTDESLLDYIRNVGFLGEVDWSRRIETDARLQWEQRWPGQVVLAVDHLLWTHGVERVLRQVAASAQPATSRAPSAHHVAKDGLWIDGNPLKLFLMAMEKQLSRVVKTMRAVGSDAELATARAVTTQTVHARDIVTSLIESQTTSPTDFDWICNLRAYWEPNESGELATLWAGDDGSRVSGLGIGRSQGKSRAAAAGVNGVTGRRKRPGDQSSGGGTGGVVLGNLPVFVTAEPASPPKMPVRVLSAVHYYQWEYVGNAPRLVVTPLTDRAYRTLLTAVHTGYGCAVSGPAGTGKTETIKDLAHAVGVRCVVFNCSDGMDASSMAKYLKGLAASGAWSCLDEFNRMEVEVLSVVAEQILTIQKNKRAGNPRFSFDGPSIPLLQACNIFVTMNPGYAGRAELPDNLKSLFRPLSMVVPDMELIVEIRLYTLGFDEPRSLASKLVQTHRLCGELLSSQHHYDFGLRTVMSVLTSVALFAPSTGISTHTVVRALEAVNAPKLAVQDVPLFRGIVSDIFADTSAADALAGRSELSDQLAVACNSACVVPSAEFLEKVEQLHTMAYVRHGVMLVGEAGCGKTSLMQVLCNALNAMADRQISAIRQADREVVEARRIRDLAVAAEMARDDDEDDDDDDLEFDNTLKVTNEGGGEGGGLPSALEADMALSERTSEAERLRSQPVSYGLDIRVLAPKAVSTVQLYGYSSTATAEWHPGILGVAASVAFDATRVEAQLPPLDPEAEHERPCRHWTVMDGPIDSVWVETLNSALDDNKKICLSSGEVIPITSRMNLVFEVDSLAEASPATVSRCGMVCVGDSVVSWRQVVTQWLSDSLPPKLVKTVARCSESTSGGRGWGSKAAATAAAAAASEVPYSGQWGEDPTLECHRTGQTAAGYLRRLFDWMLPPVLFAAGKSLTGPQRLNQGALVRSVLGLLECLLWDEFQGQAKEGGVLGGGQSLGGATEGRSLYVEQEGSSEVMSSGDGQSQWRAIMSKLEGLFAFALLWGVGGACDSRSRSVLDRLVRRLLEGQSIGDIPHRPDTAFDGSVPARPLASLRSTLLTGLSNVSETHPDVGTRSSVVRTPDIGSLFDYTLVTPQAGSAALGVATSLMGRSSSKWLVTTNEAPSAVSSTVGKGMIKRGTVVPQPERRRPAAVQWRPWLDVGAPSTTSGEVQSVTTEFGWGPPPVLFNIPRGTLFSQVFVPTSDSIRMSAIISELVLHRRHVHLSGPTGTGKTVAAKQLLSVLPPSRTVTTVANLTAATTADEMRAIVEGPLVFRRAGVLGPSMNRRAVLFLDDIGMPEHDLAGNRPALEALRAVLDRSQYHSPQAASAGKRRTLVSLEDVQVLCATATQASGSSELPLRLVRHMDILACMPLSKTSLRRVLGSIAHWFVFSSGHAVTRDLSTAAQGLADATVDLFLSASSKLKPTPLRPFYSLTILDLARVWQGVCHANPNDCRSASSLARLWGHECRRVFGDRLLDEDEEAWVVTQISQKLTSHVPSLRWPVIQEEFYSQMAAEEDTSAKASAADDGAASATDGSAANMFLFSSFVVEGSSASAAESESAAALASPSTANLSLPPKRYLQVPSDERLRAALAKSLSEYNSSHIMSPLDLVLFPGACEHMVRLTRILSLPSSNMVLLGMNGTGRLSALRVAAHLCECSLVLCSARVDSKGVEWRRDLHEALLRAGLKGEHTALVVNDEMLGDDACLSDLNLVLSHQAVPGLLQLEDEAAITELSASQQRQEQAQARDEVGAASDGGSTNDEIGSAPLDGDAVIINDDGDEDDEGAADNASLAIRSFWARAYSNLHLVVRASPVSQLLPRAMTRAPALASTCHMDFFRPWRAEELEAVARRLITPRRLVTDEGMIRRVARMLASMHDDVEKMSAIASVQDGVHDTVAPPLFLTLLRTHERLLSDKRRDLLMRRSRYDRGVQSIDETEAAVVTIRRELAVLIPQLKDADAEAEAQLGVVEKQRAAANAMKAVVEAEAADCEAKLRRAGELEGECAVRLERALPALEEAKKALSAIKTTDISVIKVMRNPPEAVKDVLAAVCILLHYKPSKPASGKGTPDYWITAQNKVLNDTRLISRLKKYQKDKMLTPLVMELLQPRLDSADFDPDVVRMSSSAAASLCRWVRALSSYYVVRQEVLPLEAALKEARAHADEAREARDGKMKELQVAEEELAGLMEEFRAVEGRRNALRNKFNESNIKVQRADKLLASLHGERSIWKAESERLGARIDALLGDTLQAAGMMAYLGPYSSSRRDEIVLLWRARLDEMGIPRSRGGTLVSRPVVRRARRSSITNKLLEDSTEELFLIEEVLSTPTLVQVWRANGLPTDRKCTENAVMMMSSHQFPLLVDPQGQAVRWVQNQWNVSVPTTAAGSAGSSGIVSQLRSQQEGSGSVVVAGLGDRRLKSIMEDAIQGGKCVIVEGCDQRLPAWMSPILAKRIRRDSGVPSIEVGDATVRWNSDFSLFLVTAEASPRLQEDVRTSALVLNFAVTFDGLRDQMLSLVMQYEKADVEASLAEAINTAASNAAAVMELEDRVLSLLSEAGTGDALLTSQHLNDALESAHSASEIASSNARKAEDVKEGIEATRKEYRPVAVRAATCFFAVAALAKLSPMYAFSLQWVQRQVRSGLQGDSSAPRPVQGATGNRTHGGVGFAQRLQNQVDSITYRVFSQAAQGLLEKHRLVFGLNLALAVLRSEGRVSDAEVAFLLAGNLSVSGRPNPTILASHDDEAVMDDDEDEDEDVSIGTPVVGGDGEEGDSGRKSAASKTQERTASASSSSAGGSTAGSSGQVWLSDESWNDLLGLEGLPGMDGICEFVVNHGRAFRRLLRSENPVEELALIANAAGDDLDTLGELPARATGLQNASSRNSLAMSTVRSVSRVPSQASIGNPLPRVDSGLSAHQRASLVAGPAASAAAAASVAGKAPTVGEQTTSVVSTSGFRLGGLQQPTGPASMLRRTGRVRQEEAIREKGRRSVGGPLAIAGSEYGQRRWKYMTMFQQLMLLRCLRKDILSSAAQEFISAHLGPEFLAPVAGSLEGSFRASTWDTPILLVLSPGSDPTGDLIALAESTGKARDLKIVSLGRGRTAAAELKIEDARATGAWICLQNCHLATSWLPKLEEIVSGFTAGSADQGFRLWLTSSPTDKFPRMLLEKCIKVSTQAPRGIRASMVASLNVLPSDWLEDSPQPTVLARLLFGLIFFHAVCIERSRYGPSGWSQTYEFSPSDLAISVAHMRLLVDAAAPASAVTRLEMRLAKRSGRRLRPHAEEAAETDLSEGPVLVPFDTLEYVVAQCHYGGRIVAEGDRRVLLALLRRSFGRSALPPPPHVTTGEAALAPMGTPGALSECGAYLFPQDSCGSGLDPFSDEQSEEAPAVKVKSAVPSSPIAVSGDAATPMGQAPEKAEQWFPTIAGMLEHVLHEFPESDNPTVCGLHASAGASAAAAESRHMVDSTLRMQTADIGTGEDDMLWLAGSVAGAVDADASAAPKAQERSVRVSSKKASVLSAAAASLTKTSPETPRGAGPARGDWPDSEVAEEAAAPGILTASLETTTSIVKELLLALPNPSEGKAINEAQLLEHFPLEGGDLVSSILHQEVHSANLAIERLGGRLRQILGVCTGTVASSPEIQGDMESLALGEVPSAWNSLVGGMPSALTRPMSWTRRLLARVQFLKDWASRTDKRAPPSVWVPGLWRPAAFLTALRQLFARRSGIPLDEVEFEVRILSVVHPGEALERPPSGAYIHGLHAIGGGWDLLKGQLSEASKQSALLPVVWLRPSRVGSGSSRVVHVPVYATARRKDLITSLRVEALEPDHWVLRGLCFVCEAPQS